MEEHLNRFILNPITTQFQIPLLQCPANPRILWQAIINSSLYWDMKLQSTPSNPMPKTILVVSQETSAGKFEMTTYLITTLITRIHMDHLF